MINKISNNGFGIIVTEEEESAKKYLHEVKLLSLLDTIDDEQIKPNYIDLARLHRLIRHRKVFTILEFGIGFSTLVMAHGIRLNYNDWKQRSDKPDIRSSTPFTVNTVDASSAWIAKTEEMIPRELQSFISITESKISVGTFNDRFCHFYHSIPDVVPDFIYLDGPDPSDVSGTLSNIGYRNLDRAVMSGDILRLEPLFLPGTMIVVDGRTNNCRFIENNFQRNYTYIYDEIGDVTIFELSEHPLGKFNKNKINYCLGIDYYDRCNI